MNENDSLLKRQSVEQNASINAQMLPNETNWKQRHQGKITAFILFLMSVLNVTDRYTVSSALIDIEVYFDISKSTAGLLQTAFLLVYMSLSLPNGYLGDRYNRKYILCTGIVIWLTASISGSFMNRNQFFLFVLSRCLFGVATASFETIAVPILGDRFLNDLTSRRRAVILFNFGPPVGYGLAFLIETVAKDLWPNDWRFTLRLTPFILVLTLLIIIVGYEEPKRLKAKEENGVESEKRGFLDDLKILSKNKTYILLIVSWTLGLTSLGKFKIKKNKFFYKLCNIRLSDILTLENVVIIFFAER